MKEDWTLKFAALLLCQHIDSKTFESINCKNLVTAYCLTCKSYFCEEHYNYHLCEISDD